MINKFLKLSLVAEKGIAARGRACALEPCYERSLPRLGK